MALNIRNKTADDLATSLAQVTGESKTEAVIQALRERLERQQRRRRRRSLADELNEIAAHCASLPRLTNATADEILGYDEHGLPR
ncbi:MAG: type II toxin-antitoxin system VapB family antitoxin [Steroidobacteraceae bacterium]